MPLNTQYAFGMVRCFIVHQTTLYAYLPELSTPERTVEDTPIFSSASRVVELTSMISFMLFVVVVSGALGLGSRDMAILGASTCRLTIDEWIMGQ